MNTRQFEKWFAGQEHRTVNFGVRRSKVKVKRGRRQIWRLWRRHKSRPPWVEHVFAARCRHVVSVCVSLCPSVTFLDHVKTNKRVFFSVPNFMALLRRGTLTGASNARGYEKMRIFDQYLALSPTWCKIEPYLLGKANRKPHPIFPMVQVLMILSDL